MTHIIIGLLLALFIWVCILRWCFMKNWVNFEKDFENTTGKQAADIESLVMLNKTLRKTFKADLEKLDSTIDDLCKEGISVAQRLETIQKDIQELKSAISPVISFNQDTGKIKRHKTQEDINKAMKDNPDVFIQIQKFPDPGCKRCYQRGTTGRNIKAGNKHIPCSCLKFA